MRLLQCTIANNVMQQKGSFCRGRVRCKRVQPVGQKGVMGLHIMGKVLFTNALFKICINANENCICEAMIRL